VQAPRVLQERERARDVVEVVQGSPMPMNTRFVGRRPASFVARYTCSTISPAVRLRPYPSVAVAQKPQSMAQPTCDDTHSVSRSRSALSFCWSSGMSTDSMARSSTVRKRSLRVPSRAACTTSCRSGRSGRLASAASASRTARGTFVISSTLSTACSCSHRNTCSPR
jgi:hypothetical protein